MQFEDSYYEASNDDSYWTDQDWAEEAWLSGTEPAVAGLRLVLSDAYADASDEEMTNALTDIMAAMSPAEALSFGTAFNQIARGANRALSDPTVAPIAHNVLKSAGPVLGTMIAGPGVGTAVGGQLGTLATKALPAPRTTRARGVAAVPATVRTGARSHGVATVTPAATPLAGGSPAAAKGVVLLENPLMKQALAAAAFGNHGQQQVAGHPVAQLLGLLGQVINEAAAEADKLFYLSGGTKDQETIEGEGGSWSPESNQQLYNSLIDAENIQLAETLDDSEEAAL